MDNKTIAVNAAVEVSFLNESEQVMLIDAIVRQEATPTLNQAQRLKKYSMDGKLGENIMGAIMMEEKPLDNKLMLKDELLSPYFPKNYTPMQKQQTILKLLADWHKRQMRQQEAERRRHCRHLAAWNWCILSPVLWVFPFTIPFPTKLKEEK